MLPVTLFFSFLIGAVTNIKFRGQVYCLSNIGFISGMMIWFSYGFGFFAGGGFADEGKWFVTTSMAVKMYWTITIVIGVQMPSSVIRSFWI